jgi:hypothetical protein
MNRRKREESKKNQLEGEEIQDLEEAVEEQMQIEDDDRSGSSEGEGEDLMEDMEK